MISPDIAMPRPTASRRVVACASDISGVELDKNGHGVRGLALFDLGIAVHRVIHLFFVLCERFPRRARADTLGDLLLTGPSIAEIALQLKAHVSKAVGPSTRKTSAPLAAYSSCRTFLLGLLFAFALAPAAATSVADTGGAFGFELDADGCIKDYKSGVDYFPAARRAIFTNELAIVPGNEQYAEDFAIDYYKTYKVVRNLMACERNSTACSTGLYLLNHCGAPALEDLSANEFNADLLVNGTVFSVPVKSWSTSSTIGITFMEEIGLGPQAVLADMKYVTSPCLQKRYGCDAVQSVGVGWADSSVWKELVIESGAELHLVDKWSKTGLNVDVRFDASTDPGLLERGEWVKYVAAFFNKEPRANSVYQGVQQRFLAIENAVAVARAASGETAPVVAIVNPGYSPQLFNVDVAEYKVEALQKAGGQTLSLSTIQQYCGVDYAPEVGCDNENFKDLLKTVDIVIDTKYPDGGKYPEYTIDTFKKVYNITDEESEYPFLTSNRFYRFDGTLDGYDNYGEGSKAAIDAPYGNDFQESAVVHCDWFLYDLAAVITPFADLAAVKVAIDTNGRSYNRPASPSFLRNLALGEMPVLVTGKDCLDLYSTCPGEIAPAPLPEMANYCVDKACLIAQPPGLCH